MAERFHRSFCYGNERASLPAALRSLFDDGGNYFRARFVDVVSDAFDYGKLALGPDVVSSLKVRVDDLIGSGDDAPTRL